jgi:hypothetical protein
VRKITRALSATADPLATNFLARALSTLKASLGREIARALRAAADPLITDLLARALSALELTLGGWGGDGEGGEEGDGDGEELHVGGWKCEMSCMKLRKMIDLVVACLEQNQCQRREYVAFILATPRSTPDYLRNATRLSDSPSKRSQTAVFPIEFLNQRFTEVGPVISWHFCYISRWPKPK